MDRITDAYARLPSTMEILPRKRQSLGISNSIKPDVTISDRDTCLICGERVDIEPCERCGFQYCTEHAGNEYHKCLLPKNNDRPKKEMHELALEMRYLTGREIEWEKKLKMNK